MSELLSSERGNRLTRFEPVHPFIVILFKPTNILLVAVLFLLFCVLGLHGIADFSRQSLQILMESTKRGTELGETHTSWSHRSHLLTGFASMTLLSCFDGVRNKTVSKFVLFRVLTFRDASLRNFLRLIASGVSLRSFVSNDTGSDNGSRTA